MCITGSFTLALNTSSIPFCKLLANGVQVGMRCLAHVIGPHLTELNLRGMPLEVPSYIHILSLMSNLVLSLYNLCIVR